MTRFNEILKELRIKNKLNQRYMATILKISQPAYVNYEKGAAEPSIDTICKLATMFNVSVDELIGFTELKEQTNIINLDYVDETRKGLIIDIMQASDIEVGRLEAYFEGIKIAQKDRDEIIKRIKGQKNND